MISWHTHFQRLVIKTKFFDYCDCIPRKVALACGRALDVSQVVISKESELYVFFVKFRRKETLDELEITLN